MFTKAHMLRIFIFAWILLSLAACKSEDPNPELKDPIYRDLSDMVKSTEKQLVEGQKALETAQTELAKTPPRSLERKLAQRELDKAQAGVKNLPQRLEYLKIRAERRRVEARKAYKIAFKQGQAWPDPHEYRSYLANKNLNSTGRNWGSRVPNIHRRKKPEASPAK